MAISLEDKLKSLPIDRQKSIKKATDELLRQEYALREAERKQLYLNPSIQLVIATPYIMKSIPVFLKVIL